jgi:hypothetical protein
MKTFIIVFFALILFSCVSQVHLVPVSSLSSSIPDASSDSIADIHLLIEPQAWSGYPEVTRKVTPVRVTIQNKSGNLLRVRTSEFAFIGDNGIKYAALPPYEIKGTIDQPIPPGFSEEQFLIAPYYAAYYPDIPRCPAEFMYDQSYYDYYYPAWARYRLPTKEMLRLALPDGVVDVGGHVSGFLYFQKISSKEQTVRFVAKLVNAVNGELIGTINIPFRVVKE